VLPEVLRDSTDMKTLVSLAATTSLFALSLTGCSGGVSGGALTSPAGADRPVIGKLQTRDRAVTLLAARDGLRVTVEDSSGSVLARDVPVDDLRFLDGVTYELFRSSVAARSVSGLDARLDPVEPASSR
jgi:hypothetical protein